jgi:hypothetical protein
VSVLPSLLERRRREAVRAENVSPDRSRGRQRSDPGTSLARNQVVAIAIDRCGT